MVAEVGNPGRDELVPGPERGVELVAQQRLGDADAEPEQQAEGQVELLPRADRIGVERRSGDELQLDGVPVRPVLQLVDRGVEPLAIDVADDQGRSGEVSVTVTFISTVSGSTDVEIISLDLAPA